jgi:DNA-entry nuclease
MYRVTPIYEGDNLIASDVLMEARSVEDPSIQYCAYCFNVQPEIEINCAIGENSGPASSAASAPSEESTYILNTNTMKLHIPSCPSSFRSIRRSINQFHAAQNRILLTSCSLPSSPLSG